MATYDPADFMQITKSSLARVTLAPMTESAFGFGSKEQVVMAGPYSSTPLSKLPTVFGTAVTDPRTHDIALGQRLGYGALWHVFPVLHHNLSLPSLSWVMKIATVREPDPEHSGEPYSASEVDHAVKRDFDILCGPLESLQGGRVPITSSLFAARVNGRTVWSILQENGGHRVQLSHLTYPQK